MTERAGSTVAVVPVKELVNAKQRLAGVLAPGERSGLFRAMVQDVLTSLHGCQGIDAVWVITDDSDVSEVARACGAEVKPEPATRGLIGSTSWAAAELAALGARRMLFVAGDVPLLDVQELTAMLVDPGVDGPAFVISPARDLGGSNCVVCTPPDCMEFGFGEDSFRRHLATARRLGVQSRVVQLPGIGLDVDTPEDLRELLRRLKTSTMATCTRRYLEESGIMNRLASN